MSMTCNMPLSYYYCLGEILEEEKKSVLPLLPTHPPVLMSHLCHTSMCMSVRRLGRRQGKPTS